MISKKMEEAINKQINEELFSAYLYQSMSADFAEKNLKGSSKWMNVQAQEELNHARKFYDFIIERGGKVVLDAIAKPRTEWASPLETFKEAYKHELHITSKINALVEIAEELKDYPASVLLQWFVKEQVEEEADADEIVKTLEMIGDGKQGLIMMDRELGKRGS